MGLSAVIPEFSYLNEVIVKPIVEGTGFPVNEVWQSTSRNGGKTMSMEITGINVAVACKYAGTSADILWFREQVNDANELFEDVLETHEETGIPALYKDHSIGNRRIRIFDKSVTELRVFGLATKNTANSKSVAKLGLKRGKKKYGIIIFEEAHQIPEDKVKAIKEAVRGYEHLIIVRMTNPWLLHNELIHMFHSALPYDEKQLAQPPYRQFVHDTKNKRIIHYSTWRNNPFIKGWQKDNFIQLENTDRMRARVASHGLPGVTSGAVYTDYLPYVQDIDLLPEEHFVHRPSILMGGVDWGYVNDTATAQLWGTDSEYSWVAGYESWEHNNKKDRHMTHIEMIEKVVEFYVKNSTKYKLVRKGNEGYFKVAVDNANLAVIELLNTESERLGHDDWLTFVPSIKPPINKRVMYTTASMSAQRFFMSKTKMLPLWIELEMSMWEEVTTRNYEPKRADLNDHHINGMEYAIYEVIYSLHDVYKERHMDKEY